MSINIDQPKFDQGTYIGRAKHFFMLTNPLNVFATEKQLNDAKQIVETFRCDYRFYRHSVDWICCITCKNWVCGMCNKGSNNPSYECVVCEDDSN